MNTLDFPDEKLPDSAAVAKHVDSLVNQAKIHWSEKTPDMLEELGDAISASPDLELRLKWAKFVVMDLLGGTKKQEDAKDRLPVFNFNFNRAASRIEIKKVDPDTGEVMDVFSVNDANPTPTMAMNLATNNDLGFLDV